MTATLPFDIRRTMVIVMMFIMAAAISISVDAEMPDSLGRIPGYVNTDSLPSFMIPSETEATLPPAANIQLPVDYRFTPSTVLFGNNKAQRLAPLHYSFAETPTLAGWQGGSLTASGSAVGLRGLMGIESGRISFIQTLGPLTLSAWAGATKYGYFCGLQTSYGFGGQLDYRINDRWSITAFGQYFTSAHPLTPAMAGYMSSPMFGGYASYNINDHWGISVGGQATRSLMTNRWEAQPIVMPYYRVNKKVSIGIDVGGILYNLAKDYIDSRRSYDYSGVPLPAQHQVPRPSPPPIAPRR